MVAKNGFLTKFHIEMMIQKISQLLFFVEKNNFENEKIFFLKNIFFEWKKLFQKTGFSVILSTFTFAISVAFLRANAIFSQTHSKFFISLFIMSELDCLFSEKPKSFIFSLVNLQIATLTL